MSPTLVFCCDLWKRNSRPPSQALNPVTTMCRIHVGVKAGSWHRPCRPVQTQRLGRGPALPCVHAHVSCGQNSLFTRNYVGLHRVLVKGITGTKTRVLCCFRSLRRTWPTNCTFRTWQGQKILLASRIPRRGALPASSQGEKHPPA